MELPVESRDAVVLLVSEEDDVLEEARMSVLTMERRGERWRGSN